MEILESMRQKLSPLRFYKTGTNGVLDADLSACAEALDEAKDTLLELERESLLKTAESWGISLKGRLYSLADGGDFIKSAVSFQRAAERSGHPVTKAEYLKLAESLGLSNVEIVEQPASHSVVFLAEAGTADPAFAARVLKRFLPADVAGLLDLRGAAGTWGTLDAAAQTWEALDALGKTWETLEAGVYIL